MLAALTCVHCGTKLKSRFRVAPGKKIRCGACGHELPPQAMEDLLRMQGLMRMGDDDGGGGGDWGGGGHDHDHGKGDAEEEEDDDEEEDDGKGGKKKKKPKTKVVQSGGFFQSMLHGFISRVIAGVVFLGLLGGCCCCLLGYGAIREYFDPTPPFVGTWAGSITIKQTVKEDAKKEENKDDKVKDKKDKTEKKDDKGPEMDVPVPITLELVKIDQKHGTGSVTYEYKDGDKKFDFAWRDHDKDKKQVVFAMDNSEARFWKDVKSPANFTYEVASGRLTLTAADGQAMTFTRKIVDAGGGAPKGGGNKGDKKK